VAKTFQVIDPQVAIIAATKFQRRRADGTLHEWQQEDESAVTTKEECIGVIQRTIDFFIPKMAEDLRAQKGLPPGLAIARARLIMRTGMTEMIDQPFAKKWGVQVEDFTYNADY
jgi:hypothetical protein